jgi:elongator complex protein 1
VVISVLAGIRQLIERKDYGAAFATCRTQRVDMNILYDHRPAQFLANVGLFLDQVKDAANIDLFLSTLKYAFASPAWCLDRTFLLM